MRPIVGFVWSGQVAVASRVTATRRLGQGIGIDRINHFEVKNMSGNEPPDHENSKGNIASDLISEVFQDFGKLKASICQLIGGRISI